MIQSEFVEKKNVAYTPHNLKRKKEEDFVNRCVKKIGWKKKKVIETHRKITRQHTRAHAPLSRYLPPSLSTPLRISLLSRASAKQFRHGMRVSLDSSRKACLGGTGPTNFKFHYVAPPPFEKGGGQSLRSRLICLFVLGVGIFCFLESPKNSRILSDYRVFKLEREVRQEIQSQQTGFGMKKL